MLVYIAIIFCVSLLLIVQVVFSRRSKLKKKRKSFQEAWGKAHNKNRSLNLIGLFYQLTPPDFAVINHLDEETCIDIDFPRLFDSVDHTSSRVGEQYLYAQLMSPTGATQLIKERASLMKWVDENEQKRLDMQMALSQLDAGDIYDLPLLFANNLPFNKEAYLASEALKWLAIFVTIGAFFDLRFVFAIVVLFFVNLVFHYFNKKYIKQYLQAFVQLSNLIGTAEKIKAIESPLVDHSNLAKCIEKTRKLRRNLGIINMDALEKDYSETTAFMLIFFEYIKIMFLIEVNSYYKSLKELENKKSDLYEIYCAIGRVDATIATASFRASLPYSCTPVIIKESEKQVIDFKDAYHPLISECVANSINIQDEKGTLISGSNMSGKTSFLRTIGINILFAQSISICLAKECCIPPLRIFTSIQIADDIEEGKSYYIKEVERIYDFIEETKSHGSNFFLLDEVFKGTNTVERVAAASAVLSHLNKGENYVMVATHDIELIQILKDTFDPYYFSEEIQNSDSIYFDHKIKKGVLREGNAIKLLKFFQFPDSIVEEAIKQKQNLLADRLHKSILSDKNDIDLDGD